MLTGRFGDFVGVDELACAKRVDLVLDDVGISEQSRAGDDLLVLQRLAAIGDQDCLVRLPDRFEPEVVVHTTVS
jgi:hypothetical protein